jgi:hypothetical protein
VNSRVVTKNRVRNDACDLIEQNIIDTEAPNKVVDVADMLLMGLRGKECFEEPFAIMNLVNVRELCKVCHALPHDGRLSGTIVDFLYADGASRTSVNDTLVVLDRGCGASLGGAKTLK